MKTISEVIDYESENPINAEDFFAQDTDVIFKQRYELEKAIQQNIKMWVCPFCRQPVKIRGKKNGEISMHFTHVADRLDCPLKTWKNYTKDQILRMRYNGQKESPKHQELKTLIAAKLSEDPRFSKIKVEKRFVGVCKDWRKPDVSTIYDGKNIVFELQLTTTFLSVIAERNIFYENNKTYIIWIFDNRRQNIEDMRFTEKDIYYPNNHNAFFISENSKRNGFKLICGYEKPTIISGSIKNVWEIKEVDFSELTFGDNFKIYWFDYESELKVLQEQVKNSQLLEFENLWIQTELSDERKRLFHKFSHLFGVQSHEVKFYELSGLLDCLYSIKFGKVIGYNYQKVIQLLHQFFQKDIGRVSHFGEYAFKAIGVYGTREQILQEDRTGKFVARAKVYKKQQVELSHKYDAILKPLFPELWENKSTKAEQQV